MRLHESSCDGDLSHVSALVNGGADVNLRDKYGNTALIRAAGQPRLVFASDPLDLTTPLFCTGSGKLKMVELLLARGAQVNAQNGDGNTALHFRSALRAWGASRMVRLTAPLPWRQRFPRPHSGLSGSPRALRRPNNRESRWPARLGLRSEARTLSALRHARRRAAQASPA